MKIFAVVVLGMLTAGSAALAQPRSLEQARADALLGPGSRSFPTNTPYRGPRGELCVPWCPADLNPCDPPEFKRTDNRCSRGAR
jgi:hypothetical protein